MAPASKSTRPQARGSGARTVHDRLRNAILDLSLAPGSPLDEVRLAERFDMSRTAIREALVRLSAEGLVTTLPNRNTIVSSIDLAGLPMYFESLTLMYRVTLRGAAADRGVGHIDKIRTCADAYAAAVETRDALAMIQTNRDFHVAIAKAAGNPYFTGFFMRLLDEGRRILRLYYSSFDDILPRRYVQEHTAMIEAIGAGDADLCDRLGALHAAQIVRQIQSYIARDRVSAISLET